MLINQLLPIITLGLFLEICINRIVLLNNNLLFYVCLFVWIEYLMNNWFEDYIVDDDELLENRLGDTTLMNH